MQNNAYDLVIRGGRVVDPESGRDEIVDVGIRSGIIGAIGAIPKGAGGKTLDASGKVVCPGFVDIHAHGQSVAADWMQAFDGVTTALELEVGVLPGTSGRRPKAGSLLLNAQGMGLPITVEAYPYGTGSTVVSAAFFADPEFPKRTGSAYGSIELIHNRHQMRDRDDLLSARQADPGALVAWHFLDLDRNDAHRVLLDLSVLYPGGAIASDAMPWIEPDGSLYRGAEWPLPQRLSSHPRSAGTFSKFLGDYHRERGRIGLREAIGKCTLIPSRIIEGCLPQMRRKARLQEGCDADIAVFDPETVAGRASFTDMTMHAAGMDALLVGGTPVILDGSLDTQVRPGRAVRCGRRDDEP